MQSVTDYTVTHLPSTAFDDLHIMNHPEFPKWTSKEVVKTSRCDYCNHVMTEVSGPVTTHLCWPGRAKVPRLSSPTCPLEAGRHYV